MKPDERELLTEFARRGGAPQRGVFLRDLGAELGIHPKRVVSIAEKWSRKGWYDYGVSADLGWLEAPGIEAAAPTREAQPDAE